jgi:hypothetical protein
MLAPSRVLLKANPSIFAGKQPLMSMNDRRIQRKPGNPIRKWPYYGSHSWNYKKKYICLDHHNPDPNTTTSQFLISYDPTKDSEVVRAAERSMKQYLPGSKIILQPSRDVGFSITRLSDSRVIVSTEATDSDDIDPLMMISSPPDLVNNLENMQQLIAYSRFY